MKKLIAITTALVLLSPALALAEGPGAGLRGDVRAEARMGDDSRKLGPAIKNLASTTRAELKGAASSTREIIRHKLDDLHDLIETHKDTMQKRADDARERAKERFGEHVQKLVGTISDRLASSSARLAAIATRIDTRITALEAQGYDMSSSSALLAVAQSDLAAANVKITAVNQTLADAMSMSTTTAKAKIPAVRAAVVAAEDALKLVKSDLAKTLGSIKVEAQVTTTVSN